MSDKNYLGDLQRFGDVSVTPLENAMRYYHLNAYQRKSVKWLYENHLSEFCGYWDYAQDDYQSVITITRTGFNKITQLIILTAVVVKPLREKLQMQVVEVRSIAIGKKGGMRLLNPKRRGTVPHGKSVLLAEPDFTILGVRTDFRKEVNVINLKENG